MNDSLKDLLVTLGWITLFSATLFWGCLMGYREARAKWRKKLMALMDAGPYFLEVNTSEDSPRAITVDTTFKSLAEVLVDLTDQGAVCLNLYFDGDFWTCEGLHDGVWIWSATGPMIADAVAAAMVADQEFRDGPGGLVQMIGGGEDTREHAGDALARTGLVVGMPSDDPRCPNPAGNADTQVPLEVMEAKAPKAVE